MNGSGRYFLALLAANVIVTLALLVFAWFFREQDKSIATLVVGALLAHWFRESGQLGRTVARASNGTAPVTADRP
jgi:hypothetical protein